MLADAVCELRQPRRGGAHDWPLRTRDGRLFAQRRRGTLARSVIAWSWAGPCTEWMRRPCRRRFTACIIRASSRHLRLRDRRGREQQSRIIVDGWRETCRALEGNVEPLELFVCEPLLDWTAVSSSTR